MKRTLPALPIFLLVTFSGCAQNNQPPKRYHLQGEVLSTDVPTKILYVKHGDIPGYMGAMSMGYAVRDANEIAPLCAGDKIQADVVVENGQGRLENTLVTEKAAPAPAGTSLKH